MAAPRSMRVALGELLRTFIDHIGAGRLGRTDRIDSRDGLRRFIESRASHVAQTSLYGYLRTRAGTRYPELFADEDFAKSIEIAKWYVWLACLSDLAVYAGGLLARRTQTRQADVGDLMVGVVDAILDATVVPDGAVGEFPRLAEEVRRRVAGCDWLAVADDESAFAQSPAALIRWAPVIVDLKRLDDEIVRNSVRYRWLEVRRDLRRSLDAEALMDTAASCAAVRQAR